MQPTSYHDRPEWSYSQMKVILDSGIDYAVATKRKMLPGPASTSIDLGELVHMFVLGGDEKQFVMSPYQTFRTNEAKAWRETQIKAGKTIIRPNEYASFAPIVDNVKAHPRSTELLYAEGAKHEVEMYATINGVALRSKADTILYRGDDSLIVADLKTTSYFDRWAHDRYFAMNKHYDLQAALYLLVAAKSLGVSPNFCNFWFCVAEAKPPYRIQYHHATQAFLESGEQKLVKCLETIKEFGDREPNFLIEEVNELGDWSL